MENDFFHLKKLKDYRKSKDLTQEEMSKILNLGSTTYKNYENNVTEPSISTLVKIADFYNTTLDELLGRESETINLKFLGETEAYLIKKILKMNQLELDKTKAYVMGLTE